MGITMGDQKPTIPAWLPRSQKAKVREGQRYQELLHFGYEAFLVLCLFLTIVCGSLCLYEKYVLEPETNRIYSAVQDLITRDRSYLETFVSYIPVIGSYLVPQQVPLHELYGPPPTWHLFSLGYFKHKKYRAQLLNHLKEYESGQKFFKDFCLWSAAYSMTSIIGLFVAILIIVGYKKYYTGALTTWVYGLFDFMAGIFKIIRHLQFCPSILGLFNWSGVNGEGEEKKEDEESDDEDGDDDNELWCLDM